jgi:hypothetical protein
MESSADSVQRSSTTQSPVTPGGTSRDAVPEPKRVFTVTLSKSFFSENATDVPSARTVRPSKA